ncbi:MAG: hypothetical protein RLZZ175_1608 [Bacteroidota bacterium]|jgi:GT2 family glycosyltransferase
MVKVGLVTVLFNSNDVLDGFLKSLSIQLFQNYHLYLIDNTPSDDSDAILYKLLSLYKIENYTHIKNNTNVGVAKGNNQGIELSRNAHTKYTLLLNNDIEFEQEDFLSSMLDKADNQSEMMVIPKIFFWDSKKIWMAGGGFDRLKGITYHVGEYQEDGPAFSKDEYFEYAPTCFMLINNKLFDEIGIMDEKYFVYFDDTDFVYRAFQKGYKILMMHSLHLYHKVSSSTGGSESPFTIYYGTRNRIYFIRKQFTGLNYVKAMTFTFLTRLIKHFQYDKVRREKMWKGYFDGLKL